MKKRGIKFLLRAQLAFIVMHHGASGILNPSIEEYKLKSVIRETSLLHEESAFRNFARILDLHEAHCIDGHQVPLLQSATGLTQTGILGV